ncbi:MAG TPA: hypothetical protein VKJ07_07395, partial [Mycobacteriales bacterium]|nr:hypothetical protein [Mycobacteriales bacterium]
MRRLLLPVAIVLACAGAAAGYWLSRSGSPRVVRGSSTKEFVQAARPTPKKIPGVAWPTYGYDL